MAKSKYTPGGKSIRSNKKTARGAKPRAGGAKSFTPSRQIVTQLDEHARAYIRLLLDPCNAPLTYSTNPMTGAFVTRFNLDWALGTGTAQDLGMLLQPGNFAGDSGNGGMYFMSSAPGSNMTVTPTPIPGIGNMRLNASVCRPIAACLDMYYTGAELYRSGIVGTLYNTGQQVEALDVFTCTQLLSNCYRRDRMPTNKCTVKWRPNNEADQQIRDPNLSYSATVESTRNSQVGLLFPSCDTNFNGSIRVTVVWEWTPKTNTSAVGSPYSKHSTTPHATVLGIIDKMEGWMEAAVETAGHVKSYYDAGKRAIGIAEGALPMLLGA